MPVSTAALSEAQTIVMLTRMDAAVLRSIYTSKVDRYEIATASALLTMKTIQRHTSLIGSDYHALLQAAAQAQAEHGRSSLGLDEAALELLTAAGSGDAELLEMSIRSLTNPWVILTLAALTSIHLDKITEIDCSDPIATMGELASSL